MMHIIFNALQVHDMTSNMTIRIDSELKKEAEELFSDLGMNLTTAVNVFFRQAVRRQQLPFSIGRYPLPNAETLAAIEEGKRIAYDPNTPRFKTMEELIKDLNS